MATFNIPYTFVNGTTIIADEHNDNWVGIKAFAEGISAGTNIDGNAITTTKIADNAVIDTKIASSAVTTAKIADNAVTTLKIADSNVTTAKINALAVTDAKIADNAVTTAKINALAVTTAKIADLNVTTAKIADLAVTAAKIANTTITNTQIATGANIDYSKLNLAGQLLIGDFGSAAKPVIICTSTTRPTTGVVHGQLIFETDKNRVYVATSTTPTWQLVSGELFATGTRTVGQSVANGSTTTLTYTAETDADAQLNTATGVFTAAQAGVYSCTVNLTSSADMNVGLGSSVNLVGPGFATACNRTEFTSSFVVKLASAGTASFQFVNGTGGSLTITYSAQFRYLGQ